ncbi:AsmA-like C-terminal domain-containing protein [Malaciobacter marinus]|uniref:YhdP family protein n=1 Tax=Malaciobacter marinus TaxID=505249 RepID=UPI003AFF84DC
MSKRIKLFILSLVCLIFAFVFLLFFGIKIDSISFGEVSVSKLYIKFDKKLIVNIKQLTFKSKKQETNNSLDNLKTNIKRLPSLLEYFKEINIETLKINDNIFTIYYDKKHLYLDNQYLNLSSKIDVHSKSITLDLYSLYLKDLKLFFKGKVKVNMFKEVVTYLGKYSYKDVSGELNLQADKDYLDFYINTNELDNIKFVKDFVRLSSNIAEAWMYDNVTGKMKLNYFYGKLKTDTFEPVLDSFEGNATIENAKIRFHKNAKTVNTKKLNVDYEDDKLKFTMEKPTYDKTKLYGSSVVINNLTSEANGEVVVNIKTKSALNDDILGILKAYDIYLPLKQTKGVTNSTFTLVVPYLLEKDMKTTGYFEAKNSTFKLQNFEFFTKDAKVQLQGSNVIIKNSHIKHQDMFEGRLNLNIDTNNSLANGDVLLNSLQIKSSDEDIINAKDLKTAINIDFSKDTILKFDDINTQLSIKNDSIDINIEELSQIYEYSALLKKLNIKSGSIDLEVFNNNKIDFNLLLDNLEYPIFKNNKKINKLNLLGQIRNEDFFISSQKKNIVIEKIDNMPLEVKLSSFDINADEFKKSSSKTNNISNENINLHMKNMNLIIDKNEYFTNEAFVNIKGSKVNFKGDFVTSTFPFYKDAKQITNYNLNGAYDLKKENLQLKTDDKKVVLFIVPNKSLKLDLQDYDLHVRTQDDNNDLSSFETLEINAQNSNIVINDEYKALAKKYHIKADENEQSFTLENKKTLVTYKKDKDKKIKIKANNLNDKFINTLANKEVLKGGSVVFIASGDEENLNGKVILSENKIENLSIITNIVTLINTSPALINPLLAIPSIASMASSEGFALNGYKVNDGYIDFTYKFETNFLNLNKIVTIGNGIDFEGKMMVDLDSRVIDGKLNLIFFKGYSSVVGAIPVLNYVFLGDNKRVETQIELSGTLDNPKIVSNIAKDSINAPVNVIKRIIKSPLKLFE